jgi:zinc transport system substrate-binding protein
VAVSIAPQVWLVEQIGGEHVEVTAMVKPGESHETYQPTDAQIAQVMTGAALFRIGIPFENGRAFRGMISKRGLRVVDTREGIELREMSPLERGGDSSHAGHGHGDDGHDDAHHHDHEGKDPHVWLSPCLLKAQARTIATTLAELDPAHRADYERNLAALEQKLDAADSEIRRTLQPHRGKMFLVFHPAWGYFADDYGLKQVAIEAEGKEPSDKEATALQKIARREGIRVVFVQPQIASRGAEAIAQAIGARLETLDPLAPDVLDNLVRAGRVIANSYR